MTTKSGYSGTETDGVFFSEDLPTPELVVLRKISVEISRQNANLLDVKKKMAEQAREVGANAVLAFTYGQRAHKGLKLVKLKWDTESWHGDGLAAVLP